MDELEIFLHLIRVRPCIEEYFLDTCIGQKLERVLDQGRVREGQETLISQPSTSFFLPQRVV